MLYHLACHATRTRDPFGKGLDARECFSTARLRELTPEVADKIFGRAIVIRKIPRGESSLMIVKHLPDRGLGINAPVPSRHLP